MILQANPILKGGKVSELLDPSLGSAESDQEKIERMILAATLCIRRSPKLRPCISVVSFLGKLHFLDLLSLSCFSMDHFILLGFLL